MSVFGPTSSTVTFLAIFLHISLGFETDEKIDWNLYHRSDVLIAELKGLALRRPNKARFEDISDRQLEQQRLPLLTITDFNSGEAGKEVVVIVAGEHAKELITSEIVLWLAYLLTGYKVDDFAEWAATQPVQATAWKSGWTKGTLNEWADKLLQTTVYKIFPIANIDGRQAVERDNTCLRKTMSGVDLNRNWPYGWSKIHEASDEFGGPKPFSEPQTRIVKDVVANFRPQAFVNLHSGEWAMYIPWDSKKEVAENLPADTDELLDKMNTYCECMKGSAGKVAGYLAFGTSMDWMFAEQHVPYPLTFEVYGPNGLGKLINGGHPRKLQQQLGACHDDPQQNCTMERASDFTDMVRQRQLHESGQEDCLAQFNPMTREDYESTVASWIGSLLVLAEHLSSTPQALSRSGEAVQEQLPEPKARPFKQDLILKGEDAVKKAHDQIIEEAFSMGRRGSQTIIPGSLPIQHTIPSKSVWIFLSAAGVISTAACLVWRRQCKLSKSQGSRL